MTRSREYAGERFVQCIKHHYRRYNVNTIWRWIEGKRKDAWLDAAWKLYQQRGMGCSRSFHKAMKEVRV